MAYTTQVRIGTVAIAQPQGVRYGAAPFYVTVAGSVVTQGSESVEFSYHDISEADLTTIGAAYAGSVNLTYGHPTAGSITRSAVWLPIQVGGQADGYYKDVLLQFTNLGTAQG